MFGTREVVKHQVVEIEKPIPHVDREAQETLSQLIVHPGFNYLLGKLKLERAKLEAILRNERHKDIKDVEFLQSGIHWTKWLEQTLNAEVGKTQQPTRPATDEEERIFQHASHLIEIVGTPQA